MVNAINGQFLIPKDNFPMKPDPVAVGVHCTLTPVLRSPTASNQSPVSYLKRTIHNRHKAVVVHPHESNNKGDDHVDRTSSEMKPETGSSISEYSCTICCESFDDNLRLKSHLKTHAMENEDPYQCNFCGKTFAVPARLTRHYRTHTGEKPYQCEYCKKSFSVKENLSVHKRIHTKERPYKCEVCDRAFEHSGKLHRHKRIHTGERPHKCNHCSKTFIQSGQLVIHLRTHTGEKPYVCKCCNKGFTCSKQLKVHTRTHTGEKPYACDICGKSFGYNHVLKLHQVSHYGEKVYKCTLCDQTFTSKKAMESHIKMTHSDPSINRNGPEDELLITSSASDKENNTVSSAQMQFNVIPHSRMTEASRFITSELDERDTCNGYNAPISTNNAELSKSFESDVYKNHLRPNRHDVNVALLAAVAAAADRQDILPHHQVHSPKLESATSSCSSYFQVASPTYSSRSSPSPKLEIVENSDDSSTYTVPEYNGLEFQKSNNYNSSVSTPVILQVPFADGFTPPNSNSTSPIPSLPEITDVTVSKDELSLPPRKRTKMILKSMEKDQLEDINFRFSSVIHYARASQIA